MNCKERHANARHSETEFRKLLQVIGVQRGGDYGPDLLQGNCPECRTTISIVMMP